ncbi:MAG: class I SAM-dependent methyltransferase [Gloeocapsa sp. UFS-A4-WI-NPMV-4B04]|nr:class I SAM-dependent methyltransferase [Gloeocapsa sp. UFS-A4-WI-NPMV-4B04]
MNQFVPVNPTYNKNWVYSLGFPEETEFDFVKCSACDFVYSQSRLNDKLNYDLYHLGIDKDKSLAKTFSIQKRLKHLSLWRKLLSLSASFGYDLSQRELKVLDFGAGWGDFLSVAKSCGIKVFGLEFDERKIEFANFQGIPLGNFEFVEKHAPYDIFMCDQVLEHLDNPRDELKKLHSLLNHKAVGFIDVPNFETKNLNSLITKINEGEMPPKSINPWGHLNYFTPSSLRAMIFDAGFLEIEEQLHISNLKKEKPLLQMMRTGIKDYLQNIVQKPQANKVISYSALHSTSLYVETKS